MKSSDLLNETIRQAEAERNDALVLDLLRVKQTEARRQYLGRLTVDVETLMAELWKSKPSQRVAVR